MTIDFEKWKYYWKNDVIRKQQRDWSKTSHRLISYTVVFVDWPNWFEIQILYFWFERHWNFCKMVVFRVAISRGLQLQSKLLNSTKSIRSLSTCRQLQGTSYWHGVFNMKRCVTDCRISTSYIITIAICTRKFTLFKLNSNL